MSELVEPLVIDAWPAHGRRGYRLRTKQFIDRPQDEVFEFFADAYQLERITPAWLKFSVQSLAPIEMASGTLIDYRLRLHGLPIRWRSAISNWEPPFQFVDEQVKGPYKYWHHLHTFERYAGYSGLRYGALRDAVGLDHSPAAGSQGLGTYFRVPSQTSVRYPFGV